MEEVISAEPEAQRKVDLLSLTMTALRISNSAVQLQSECILTMEQVSWHETPQDCWIILYDQVYDITKFLEQHPGGADILLEHAGRDGTLAFRGAGHSKNALSSLDRYKIGILPLKERLFRKVDGIKLSDMPEQ